LVWHTFLWDPWFLIWGLLVVVALALTSAKRTRGAATLAKRRVDLAQIDESSQSGDPT
jgi:hypothetical protein